MRWPWNRRQPAGAPAQAVATASQQSVLDRPTAAWAALPALQRTLPTPALTTNPVEFATGLASWRSAALTGALTRQVDPVIPRVGPDPDAWGLGGPTPGAGATAMPVAAGRVPPHQPQVQRRSTEPSSTFPTTSYAAVPASQPAAGSPGLTSAPDDGLPLVQLTAESLPLDVALPDETEPVPEPAAPEAGDASPVPSAPVDSSPDDTPPSVDEPPPSADAPPPTVSSPLGTAPGTTSPDTAVQAPSLPRHSVGSAEPAPPRQPNGGVPERPWPALPSPTVQRAAFSVARQSPEPTREPSGPGHGTDGPGSVAPAPTTGPEPAASASTAGPEPAASRVADGTPDDGTLEVQRSTTAVTPTSHDDLSGGRAWGPDHRAGEGTAPAWLVEPTTRPDLHPTQEPTKLPTPLPVQRAVDPVEVPVEPEQSPPSPSGGEDGADRPEPPQDVDVGTPASEAEVPAPVAGPGAPAPRRPRLGLGEPLPSMPDPGPPAPPSPGSDEAAGTGAVVPDPALPRPGHQPLSLPVAQRTETTSDAMPAPPDESHRAPIAGQWSAPSLADEAPPVTPDVTGRDRDDPAPSSAWDDPVTGGSAWDDPVTGGSAWAAPAFGSGTAAVVPSEPSGSAPVSDSPVVRLPDLRAVPLTDQRVVPLQGLFDQPSSNDSRAVGTAATGLPRTSTPLAARTGRQPSASITAQRAAGADGVWLSSPQRARHDAAPRSLETVQALRIGSHRASPWPPTTQPQVPGPAPAIGMPLGRPSPAAYDRVLVRDPAEAPSTAVGAGSPQPDPDPAEVQVGAAPSPSSTAPSAQADAPGGGAATAGSASEVDELARKLYDPLMLRLRAELLVERERRGLRTDAW
ncbi:hypothetical protein [Knoellia aerolata]|uniref:Uncharacterized protein n=1 Tax=Knoellia aerolata DSM 18566 TaxID=1385519 RepID=A0A0A0JYZ5_9MICO|nr:hypothetical protein [Knoellia aerolata]KGN41302.1 hypothetical protein N801_08615 [Knoellia aerolata DSM 18566]